MNDVKILPLQLELGCLTNLSSQEKMDQVPPKYGSCTPLETQILRCLQHRDILQPGLPAKDSFFMKLIFKS